MLKKAYSMIKEGEEFTDESGLYAKYKAEGESFVATYKAMLKATSVTDVEECAKIAGVDLTDKDFWRQGLQSIADRIEEFCELVG